jgi:hypothetical protein
MDSNHHSTNLEQFRKNYNELKDDVFTEIETIEETIIELTKKFTGILY